MKNEEREDEEKKDEEREDEERDLEKDEGGAFPDMKAEQNTVQINARGHKQLKSRQKNTRRTAKTMSPMSKWKMRRPSRTSSRSTPYAGGLGPCACGRTAAAARALPP